MGSSAMAYPLSINRLKDDPRRSSLIQEILAKNTNAAPNPLGPTLERAAALPKETIVEQVIKAKPVRIPVPTGKPVEIKEDTTLQPGGAQPRAATPSPQELGLLEGTKPSGQGINWAEAIKRFRIFASGAGQYTGGDWGQAVGNGGRALLQYDLQKEKDDYNKAMLDQQNAFKDMQFKNQLDQQDFQNKLAQDKFNFQKQAYYQQLNDKNIDSASSFLPPEILKLPQPRDEEERKQYIQFIERMDPNIGTVLNDLSRYKLKEADVFKNLSPDERGSLTNVLRNINPEYSSQNYDSVKELRSNLTSTDKGIGADFTRLNTALGHLNQLSDIHGQLSNSPVRAANMIKNFAGKFINNPYYDAFNTTAKQLASETERAIVGGRPAVTMVKLLLDSLSPNSTPEEFIQIRKTLEDLLNARTYALVKSTYHRTNGEGVPVSVLEPRNIKSLLQDNFLTLSEDGKYVYPSDVNKRYSFTSPDGVLYDESGYPVERGEYETAPSNHVTRYKNAFKDFLSDTDDEPRKRKKKNLFEDVYN